MRLVKLLFTFYTIVILDPYSDIDYDKINVYVIGESEEDSWDDEVIEYVAQEPEVEEEEYYIPLIFRR
ncbi:MAG: hypothetical protein V2I33_08560 [Kangiellaceae bacterium]|jgi:methenyltetrahydromethanopterin cyclohydrolase|nr:hypothetical protein [Kangiellaceae bacterium]